MNPKDRKAKTEMKPKPKTPNLPAARDAHAPALEWWPVDRPVPYARNPRRNDGAVDALAASIREFGFRSPVLVDAAGVVIAGHTRLKAARKLGLREVPVLVCADLPPEKVAALRLADNKTAELAEWDTPALDAELAELAEAGVDMEQFGFGDELAALAGTEGQTDEDAVPEPPPEPVSRRGAVYALGRHRLMCGDSTSAEDFARLMGGERADLLLTDPPYGIDVVKRGKVGGGGSTHFKGKVGAFVKSSFYIPVANDGDTSVAKDAIAIWTPGADRSIIFGGNYFTDVLTPSRCWIVWDKENTGNFADAELAWTNIDHGVKVYRFMWNGLARKGDRKEEGKTRVHPTQKPVGLFANILEDFTEPGARVLDAFLGSGTTIVACEKTGRVCYGMELDPHYCDVIRRRWAEFVHGEGCDWQTLAPEVAE